MKYIYKPRRGSPMSVVFFNSGGGGNLRALLSSQIEHPDLFRVDLVVCDRMNTLGAQHARERDIEVIEFDFETKYKSQCPSGNARDIAELRERIHDEMLCVIQKKRCGKRRFDLAVLAYR